MSHSRGKEWHSRRVEGRRGKQTLKARAMPELRCISWLLWCRSETCFADYDSECCNCPILFGQVQIGKGDDDSDELQFEIHKLNSYTSPSSNRLFQDTACVSALIQFVIFYPTHHFSNWGKSGSNLFEWRGTGHFYYLFHQGNLICRGPSFSQKWEIK